MRRALDAALEDWWQQGHLPPPELLRDGLFLLQAGHTLDASQVSLLLRAALAYHKGMLTALRHQPDGERTAVILADALLAEPPAGLTLDELARLRREDESSGAWIAALPAALYEETSSADAGRRHRALELIDALGAGLPLPLDAADAQPSSYDGYELIETEEWSLPGSLPQPARRRGVAVIWAALILVVLAGLVLGGLWWQQRNRLEGMVNVPAAVYTVSASAAGGQATVEVAAFAIDRTEVTIGAYRRCVDAGRCPQPSKAAGETRPNYLLDPAFERFPMVNVDWSAASAYCVWRGKRLPSAVEWEAAAGSAPGSAQPRTYPWGEQFQLQRANSIRTGIGDTQEVGSYQPIGDSALGISDLAGNVAEWTGTNVGRVEGSDEDRFLVKGGSYRSDPAGLTVAVSTEQAASFSAPWLGFRCAMDLAR